MPNPGDVAFLHRALFYHQRTGKGLPIVIDHDASGLPFEAEMAYRLHHDGLVDLRLSHSRRESTLRASPTLAGLAVLRKDEHGEPVVPAWKTSEERSTQSSSLPLAPDSTLDMYAHNIGVGVWIGSQEDDGTRPVEVRKDGEVIYSGRVSEATPEPEPVRAPDVRRVSTREDPTFVLPWNEEAPPSEETVEAPPEPSSHTTRGGWIGDVDGKPLHVYLDERLNKPPFVRLIFDGSPIVQGYVFPTPSETAPEPVEAPSGAEEAGVSPSVHEAPAESDIARVLAREWLGDRTEGDSLRIAHVIAEAWRTGAW